MRGETEDRDAGQRVRETHSPTPTTTPPPMPTSCHRESITPWRLQAHLDLASCYLVPTPARVRDPLAAAHARPTCRRRRWLLDLPSPASMLQPSQFTGIYSLLLSFPSKPNKMFVTLWSENLRFIESRNCACVVPCGLVNWLRIWLCAAAYGVFFFFFCLAFWLCDSVTLCLWLFIGKRDRERERETESRVCKD